METVTERTPAIEMSNDAASRAALQKAIARRARELYELRGCVDGHALEDWLQAEADIMNKLANPQKDPDA